MEVQKASPEDPAKDREQRRRREKPHHIYELLLQLSTQKVSCSQLPNTHQSWGKDCNTTAHKDQKTRGLLLHTSNPTVHWTWCRTRQNLLTPSVKKNKHIKIMGAFAAIHLRLMNGSCLYNESSNIIWVPFDTTWMKISFYDGGSILKVDSLIICSLGSFR